MDEYIMFDDEEYIENNNNLQDLDAAFYAERGRSLWDDENDDR
jgi:hypothetical protein